MLSKEASSTIFESLVWLNLGLNPGLPGHWRTLLENPTNFSNHAVSRTTAAAKNLNQSPHSLVSQSKRISQFITNRIAETKMSFIFWNGHAAKNQFGGVSSSSSSSRAVCMGLPDPLSPPVSIVHRSGEVFKAIVSLDTDLLYMGSGWSSYLCLSMWKGPQEYVAYEFVLTSPTRSHLSGSSNLDSFRHWW